MSIDNDVKGDNEEKNNDVHVTPEDLTDKRHDLDAIDYLMIICIFTCVVLSSAYILLYRSS